MGVVCSVFWSSLLILHYVVEKTNRKQLKLHDIPALRSTISTIAVGGNQKERAYVTPHIRHIYKFYQIFSSSQPTTAAGKSLLFIC